MYHMMGFAPMLAPLAADIFSSCRKKEIDLRYKYRGDYIFLLNESLSVYKFNFFDCPYLTQVLSPFLKFKFRRRKAISCCALSGKKQILNGESS